MIFLAAKSSGGNPLGLLLPLVVLFVVFYFFLIRPQQKRARRQQNLLTELHPGDEVVTIGGLFAEIVVVADDHVILEMYDGTQAKFLKSAISRRLGGELEPEEADAGEDETTGGEDSSPDDGSPSATKAGGAAKTAEGGGDEEDDAAK